MCTYFLVSQHFFIFSTSFLRFLVLLSVIITCSHHLFSSKHISLMKGELYISMHDKSSEIYNAYKDVAAKKNTFLQQFI